MTSDFASQVAKYAKNSKNPRQPKMGISITKRTRREISSPLWEIGVAEHEYDVRFCTGSG